MVGKTFFVAVFTYQPEKKQQPGMIRLCVASLDLMECSLCSSKLEMDEN